MGVADDPRASTTEKIIEEIEILIVQIFMDVFYLSQVAQLLALASILIAAQVIH